MSATTSSAVVVVIAIVVATVAVGVVIGVSSVNDGDWQDHSTGDNDQGNAANKASNVEAKSDSAVGLSSSIVTTTIIILGLRIEEVKSYM